MPTIGEMLGKARPAAPAGVAPDERVAMKASSYTAAEVEWLWRPYIPVGMVTLVTGDPEAGKGWVTCELAAGVSRGRALPGQDALPPGRVLFLSAEDSPEHVLLPRLGKQGADVDRIYISSKTVNLCTPAGLGTLERALRETMPQLVIIDPITSFMGDTDTNKPSTITELYSKLGAMATKGRFAMLTIRHRRKPADGERKARDPKFSGAGTIAFTAAARSELLVGMTEEGQRAVSHEKCSVGPHGPVQLFHLDPDTGTLGWDGASADIDGWDLMGKMKPRARGRPKGSGEKGAAALAFLRTILANGPEPAQVVIMEGERLGINKHTLVLARKEVAEAFQKPGDPRWWWTLTGGAVSVCALTAAGMK